MVLRFEREESPEQKLRKLERFLVQYDLPRAEAVPLLAALLSLPLPAEYAPLTVSPAQQKQKTLHALLTILLRIAAQQPVLFVVEDAFPPEDFIAATAISNAWSIAVTGQKSWNRLASPSSECLIMRDEEPTYMNDRVYGCSIRAS